MSVLALFFSSSHVLSESRLKINELIVSTNGLIYTGGNVGVGTSSPSEPFDVVQPANFQGLVRHSVLEVDGTTSDTEIDFTQSEKIILNVYTDTSLTIVTPPYPQHVLLLIKFIEDAEISDWGIYQFPQGITPNSTNTAGSVDLLGGFWSGDVMYGSYNANFE